MRKKPAKAAKAAGHWPLIGAAGVTIATILGGGVTVLSYIQQIQTTQTQQRSDWVAKNAVLEYRVDEAERDIRDLRDQQRHDIDQLREECK